MIGELYTRLSKGCQCDTCLTAKLYAKLAKGCKCSTCVMSRLSKGCQCLECGPKLPDPPVWTAEELAYSESLRGKGVSGDLAEVIEFKPTSRRRKFFRTVAGVAAIGLMSSGVIANPAVAGWVDNAVGSVQQISAGNLLVSYNSTNYHVQSTNGASATYTNLSEYQASPGDVITANNTYNITALGDNLTYVTSVDSGGGVVTGNMITQTITVPDDATEGIDIPVPVMRVSQTQNGVVKGWSVTSTAQPLTPPETGFRTMRATGYVVGDSTTFTETPFATTFDTTRTQNLIDNKKLAVKVAVKSEVSGLGNSIMLVPFEYQFSEWFDSHRADEDVKNTSPYVDGPGSDSNRHITWWKTTSSDTCGTTWHTDEDGIYYSNPGSVMQQLNAGADGSLATRVDYYCIGIEHLPGMGEESVDISVTGTFTDDIGNTEDLTKTVQYLKSVPKTYSNVVPQLTTKLKYS